MKSIQVCIAGHLDPGWAEWLGEVEIRYLDDGTTLLSGVFPDQSALYGLVGRLRDLGIELISIHSEDQPEEEETGEELSA